MLAVLACTGLDSVKGEMMLSNKTRSERGVQLRIPANPELLRGSATRTRILLLKLHEKLRSGRLDIRNVPCKGWSGGRILP